MSATVIEVRLPTREAVEREWILRLRQAGAEVERLRVELEEAREAEAHLLAAAHAQSGLSLRRLGSALDVSATEIRRRISAVSLA